MSKAIQKTNSRQQTKSKFEVVCIENIDTTFDLTNLFDNEFLYFNATEVAKAHGKDVRNWFKSQETQDYLVAVLAEYPSLNESFSTQLEFGKLVKANKGRYGGTYLHHILAIPFARWCSAKFAVKLDRVVYDRIQQERRRKDARLEALTGFRPLTDAIKDAHSDPQPYHYSNEINMHYLIVTGKQAKKLREEMGLSENQRPIDFLPEEQIKAIAMLRRMDEGLIRVGMTYDERKEKLGSFYRLKLESRMSPKQIANNIEA